MDKFFKMKASNLFKWTSVFMLAILVISCGGKKPYGDKVKEPFTGSKYESNNRFWRAVGKGVSAKDNIARKKADVDAKTYLAGQVNVTMKEVTDAYMAQNQNLNGAEVYEKFQDLSRQVMNTELADLRKFDEVKYYNGTEYTVFVAYEIKKSSMLSFMKKQAKLEIYVNENTRKAIEEIIDEELKKADIE
jgi:hypothetical protein